MFVCGGGGLGVEGLWAVSRVGGSARVPRFPAGELQWHFSCGFDFGHCL